MSGPPAEDAAADHQDDEHAAAPAADGFDTVTAAPPLDLDKDEGGPPACSPLRRSSGYTGALQWAGPIDDAERARIAARVDYGALPWRRRLFTRIPEGFRPVPWPLVVLGLQHRRAAAPPATTTPPTSKEGAA